MCLHDGRGQLGSRSAFEGVPEGDGFKGDYAEGEDVGKRGGRLQFDLLRRHVEQRALVAHGGMGVRHVGDAEIDDLDRVILHDEEVARFQVAVYQSALMGRLQTAAGLANDFDHAAHGQTAAPGGDQLAQGFAGKQRHDEIRLAGAILVELAEIENLYDVRVTDGGEDVALFVEKFQCGAARGIADGFERDAALDDDVVGVVDHTHAALPQHLTDFVAVFDLLRYGINTAPSSRRKLNRDIAGRRPAADRRNCIYSVISPAGCWGKSRSDPATKVQWRRRKRSQLTLWQMKTDGTGQNNLGGNTTASTPAPTADSVNFEGTDQTLWRYFLG